MFKNIIAVITAILMMLGVSVSTAEKVIVSAEKR